MKPFAWPVRSAFAEMQERERAVVVDQVGPRRIYQRRVLSPP